MRTIWFALLAMLTAQTVLPARNNLLDVASRRQVFIDGRLLEVSEGVELVVHQPIKTNQITIAPEHPWETTISGSSTVIKAGDVYHLWYSARAPKKRDPDTGEPMWNKGRFQSLAYARSQDGIHWEKPMLGLAEIFGSTENNIVLGYGAGGVKEGLIGTTVFLDPNAVAEERFRQLAYVRNPPALPASALHLFSSPDGIHWSLTRKSVIVFESKKHHLDSPNVIFWDDRIHKYAAYIRRNLRPPGSQGRAVARSESDHLERFMNAEVTPVVLAVDHLDPHHYDSREDRNVQVMDLYTNATVKYPWAQDAYYMFPSAYYHYHSRFLREFENDSVFDFESFWDKKGETMPREGQTAANTGPLDIRFAASRDGVDWHRYDRRAFVDLGMKGEFDSKSNYMILGLVPALNGREMYMYYSGSDQIHAWGFQPQSEAVRREGLGPVQNIRALSRLVLRRDGFISVRASYPGGQFTTPVLRFEGRELVLNVDTSALGTLRVEILDELANPLEGFRLADCDRIHTTNEMNRIVTWHRQSDLSRLAGKPIRLRFVMNDTDLYAFQFRQ